MIKWIKIQNIVFMYCSCNCVLFFWQESRGTHINRIRRKEEGKQSCAYFLLYLYAFGFPSLMLESSLSMINVTVYFKIFPTPFIMKRIEMIEFIITSILVSCVFQNASFLFFVITHLRMIQNSSLHKKYSQYKYENTVLAMIKKSCHLKLNNSNSIFFHSCSNFIFIFWFAENAMWFLFTNNYSTIIIHSENQCESN